MLRYYPLTLLTVLMFGSLWLGAVYCDGEWAGTIILVGFISAIILPLIFYQIMLPRWRIWAFENVRNVHELKKSAKLIRIYPADDAFEWKLEIKTTLQKERIAALDRKFERPDVFIDDVEIPDETAFDHPKALKIVLLLLAFACLSSILYCFLTGSIEIGCLLLVTTGIFASPVYSVCIQKGPIFRISNDGISTDDQGTHLWKDIENEQVQYVSGTRWDNNYVLFFEASGQKIYIDIPIDPGVADYILHIYRGRYEANKTK